MKSKRFIVRMSILVLLFCSVGAEAGSPMNNGVMSVSLINLIATPDKYHHKNIQVEGVAHMQFEDSAIYLTRDDANHLNLANAIWLKITGNTSDVSRHDGKWILVEGVFNAKEHGHMGFFSGMIESIQRIEPYEPDVKTASKTHVKALGSERQVFSEIDKKAAKKLRLDAYLGTPNGSLLRLDHETLETSEVDKTPAEK